MNENARIEDRASRYPFQWTFPVWGLVIGLVAGLAMQSVLAGSSIFTVFLCVGLLWRRNEPPILAFAISYQWVYVVTGFFYKALGGELKEDYRVGNVQGAMILSLIGFVVITVGIRVSLTLLEGLFKKRWYQAAQHAPDYDIRKLARWTIGLYAVSWIVEILPMAIFYRGAQIIYACLTIREVLLGALWLTILQRRTGYLHGILAMVIAWGPLLISTQSKFKELLFFFVIILLTCWRPWSREWFSLRLNRGILLTSAIIIATLVYVGTLWEGAIKPNWRWVEIEGTPVEKLQAFVLTVSDPIQNLKLMDGFSALFRRLDSIWQFSLVLDRVPDQVPHDGGALTRRAIMHILTPRILFPNKTDLGLDSWITTKYAGVEIGEGTSVGIGYMAEFYVDFGPRLMFVPLLCFGLLLGLVYGAFLLSNRPLNMVRAAVALPFLYNFLTFEGTFAKVLGGFLTNVIILMATLWWVAPKLHKAALSKVSVRRQIVGRRRNSRLVRSRTVPQEQQPPGMIAPMNPSVPADPLLDPNTGPSNP